MPPLKPVCLSGGFTDAIRPDLYTDFLLIPIFDERPWGVRDLRPVYTRIVKEPIGETWLTWSENRIANGPVAGRTLGEIASQFRRELVGTAAVYEDRFPLLVKFLFPADKLSVQVHPDDAAAQKIGEPCGKTECWYVLDAKPGAQVALGLKPGATLEQFEAWIRGMMKPRSLLNWIEVHSGEMLYVPAGTVRAVGGQWSSWRRSRPRDITYRLYDYGRRARVAYQGWNCRHQAQCTCGRSSSRGERRHKSCWCGRRTFKLRS